MWGRGIASTNGKTGIASTLEKLEYLRQMEQAQRSGQKPASWSRQIEKIENRK